MTPMVFAYASHQLKRLHRFWLSLQIEIGGRYSLARLDSLIAHRQDNRRLWDLASLVLLPLPSILVVLAIDALPLDPPSEKGIQGQTIGLHVRVFATVYLVTTMIVTQIQESTPSLPMSQRRIAVISFISGLFSIGCFIAFAIIIGFPTPFVMQLITGPWAAALTFMLWLSWRSHLRMDQEARASLRNYLNVFAIQVVIIFIYSAYNILFISVPTSAQTFVTLILPIIKLFVKNMVASGLVHMEDLAPAMVVFNIDVFHGMFVSSTTQQAVSINSTVVIMAVDALLLLVAFTEVELLARRVEEDRSSCVRLECGVFAPTEADLPVKVKQRTSAIDFAVTVLKGSPNIRNHEKLRGLQHEKTRRTPFTFLLRGHTLRSIVPQALQSTAADKETVQVQYVARVLGLLQTIEFYVLIEFAEVIIAAFYAAYIVAMAYSPNRKYYHQLTQYSHDEMMVLVSRTALYASAEFVSLVLMCCIMNRKLAPLSAPQQLAFVVQTHWKVVHAAMVMWIILTVQLTFEHYGTDYTFRFEWLRNQPPRP